MGRPGQALGPMHGWAATSGGRPASRRARQPDLPATVSTGNLRHSDAWQASIGTAEARSEIVPPAAASDCPRCTRHSTVDGPLGAGGTYLARVTEPPAPNHGPLASTGGLGRQHSTLAPPRPMTPPFHISQLSRQLTKVSIRRSVRRDLLTIPKPSPRRLDAAAQQHSPDVPGAPSGDPRSRLQLAVPPVRLLRGQTGEPSLPRLLAHTPKTSRIRLT
ncbi:hypothetical protein Purlil1_7411 [Purpureocillium lilacinum]|uniref:Uncharacterized protein n=1 Tax=Purpureocillium lilacinum TaxID=33203 RepID=A0ABR0BXP7_PURLI|nr:hypothetical protein Purlil1_7411 [Purpureocillium lilacinum]